MSELSVAGVTTVFTLPRMQCAMTRDLKHYERLPDALPQLPRWAKPGLTWAPCVIHLRTGVWML